jgi:hypothetical protein
MGVAKDVIAESTLSLKMYFLVQQPKNDVNPVGAFVQLG